jgi:hypothetical protein
MTTVLVSRPALRLTYHIFIEPTPRRLHRIYPIRNVLAQRCCQLTGRALVIVLLCEPDKQPLDR